MSPVSNNHVLSSVHVSSHDVQKKSQYDRESLCIWKATKALYTNFIQVKVFAAGHSYEVLSSFYIYFVLSFLCTHMFKNDTTFLTFKYSL